MYDTATHVEMVKKRIRQRQHEMEKNRIFGLSAICTLLSAALIGAGTFSKTEQINIPGLYGSILLHEGMGGYGLVGLISFTVCPYGREDHTGRGSNQ